MKRATPFFSGLLLLAIACNNPKTDTTESPTDSTSVIPPAVESGDSDAAAPAMDSAAMMKAWEAFRAPGDMHKLLATFNGQWVADVTTYMDPSRPPIKSQATQIFKPIMGGLYQAGHMTGTIMGMNFEGQSINGYDNAKKIFVSTWIDNLGSGVINMTGSWDEATKTLHYKGSQTDPVTGKDVPIRQELKVLDVNTYLLTMYGAGMDGKETKFMEATYKRT